jgi:hypothetical protein
LTGPPFSAPPAAPPGTATWARGRGWALSQALIFVPYYVNTNPVGVANAWRAIREVLADVAAGG